MFLDRDYIAKMSVSANYLINIIEIQTKPSKIFFEETDKLIQYKSEEIKANLFK